MTRFAMFSTVRRYVGKMRTLRNEIRTERLLNSLPHEVQADIGWLEQRECRRQPHKSP